MKNHRCYLLAFSAFISLLSIKDASAQPEDGKGIFNLIFENDIFANTDRGYTNGVRAAWLSSEKSVPAEVRWAANHLLPLANDGNKRISLAIGQSMFAPEDLSRHDIIRDDRPYAGWLYTSLGIVSDTEKTLDNAILTIGVVGPYSLAEQTQKFVHHVVGSPQPQGWKNQLHNELGVNFEFERKWRNKVQFSPFGLGADITPSAGATIGNVDTKAALGAMFRIGYDLPADYGPPRIRPSLPGSDFFIPTQALGGYLFAGIQGRAVARNIFLDGNSFGNSPHVDKEIFVGDLQMGVAMTYHNARISYTHVLITKEFEQQTKPSQFGAVTFSYRF